MKNEGYAFGIITSHDEVKLKTKPKDWIPAEWEAAFMHDGTWPEARIVPGSRRWRVTQNILTFDDIPNREDAFRVIDALARKGIRPTAVRFGWGQKQSLERALETLPEQRHLSFQQFLTESPRRYEYVVLNNGQRFILRVDDDSGQFLNGIEVNKEGDEVVPKGTDKDGHRFTERRHLIQKSEIKSRTRMKFNLVYGELEPIQEHVAWIMEEADGLTGPREFVHTVRAWGTPTGHGNNNSVSVKLGDHVRLDCRTFPLLGPDVVLIEVMEVDLQGKGFGTQVLRRLVELADKLNVRLALEALPFQPAKGKAIPQVKLKTWYASFGFQTARSEEHGDAYMIREPR